MMNIIVIVVDVTQLWTAFVFDRDNLCADEQKRSHDHMTEVTYCEYVRNEWKNKKKTELKLYANPRYERLIHANSNAFVDRNTEKK